VNWLIVGAGGIGATYGARLVATGERVTFVARGAHLEAMQRSSLEVEHGTFRFQAAVDAVDEDGLRLTRSPAEFDVIVVALKAQDTEAWLARWRPWLLTAPTPILSLQNGVDNESSIAEVVGAARTFGGLAVRIGAHVEAPGRVRGEGEARVVLGVWPDGVRGAADPYLAQAMGERLERTGVPVVVTSKIEVELWRKLMINVAMNPLSALTRLDTGVLSRDAAFAGAVVQMMRETQEVGVAAGVALTSRDVEEMATLIRGFDPIKTSMLVDLEKGRPLELSGLSGALLRRAAAHGVAVPMVALVHELLVRSPGVLVR